MSYQAKGNSQQVNIFYQREKNDVKSHYRTKTLNTKDTKDFLQSTRLMKVYEGHNYTCWNYTHSISLA